MAQVIVMRGVPGSGKSTYVKQNYPNAFVVSADHFFEKGGKYQFDPRKLGQAHGECLKNFTEAIRSCSPDAVIVVDNTNTTNAEMAPYAALALAYGHNLKTVMLQTMACIAAQRNQHGVPEATVERMSDTLRNESHKCPAYWNQTILHDNDGNWKTWQELNSHKKEQ